MNKKNLSDLTDEELLHEAKKLKSASITNAVFIGFLIGIIVYSIIQNSLGFFTLIPLFLIYKLVKKSKYDQQELETILKEKNFK